MKKSILSICILVFASLLLINHSSFSKTEPAVHNVGHFEKIIVSPHIRLVLEPGDIESVLITNAKIEKNKINVKVVGNTLRIFLDDAKDYTKSKKDKNYKNRYGKSRKPMYSGTLVTARVTYKELKKLSVRGEENIECLGEIKADKFRLKIFGESEVQIASIDSKYIKSSLYGENTLKINKGNVDEFNLKSYGENRVDCRRVNSLKTKTVSFGESNLNLNATDKIKITSLGESEINVSGGGKVYRGLVIGENKIYEYYSVAEKQ